MFFENSDQQKICKNEIADKKENICSRFSDKIAQKIDFTAVALYRDYPPVRKLKESHTDYKKSRGILIFSYVYTTDIRSNLKIFE